MSDKKISELQFTSSIDANDASILVRNDADLQYTFSTLLQFISNNISTGANFSFGTTLPSNLTGKNGDIFVNTATGSFAQKVSGAWSVTFTVASPTVANSSEILYGLGTPIMSAGNNGDTYINTGTGIFYQKSSGGWSQVFSMQNGPAGATGAKGADGANGLNGKTILHGSLDPSNDLGTDGDFYLNTATYFFFGPKVSGIWPTGFSIAGLGVPQGGASGQILSKASSNDYETAWVDGGFVPYTGASDDVNITPYYFRAKGIYSEAGFFYSGTLGDGGGGFIHNSGNTWGFYNSGSTDADLTANQIFASGYFGHRFYASQHGDGSLGVQFHGQNADFPIFSGLPSDLTNTYGSISFDTGNGGYGYNVIAAFDGTNPSSMFFSTYGDLVFMPGYAENLRLNHNGTTVFGGDVDLGANKLYLTEQLKFHPDGGVGADIVYAPQYYGEVMSFRKADTNALDISAGRLFGEIRSFAGVFGDNAKGSNYGADVIIIGSHGDEVSIYGMPTDGIMPAGIISFVATDDLDGQRLGIAAYHTASQPGIYTYVPGDIVFMPGDTESFRLKSDGIALFNNQISVGDEAYGIASLINNNDSDVLASGVTLYYGSRYIQILHKPSLDRFRPVFYSGDEGVYKPIALLEDVGSFVPYSGATEDVSLGSHSLGISMDDQYDNAITIGNDGCIYFNGTIKEHFLGPDNDTYGVSGLLMSWHGESAIKFSDGEIYAGKAGGGYKNPLWTNSYNSYAVDLTTNQTISGEKTFIDLLMPLDVAMGGYLITGRANFDTSDFSFFYSQPYGGLLVGFNRSHGNGEVNYIASSNSFDGAAGGHRFMGIDSTGEEIILLDVDGIGNITLGNAINSDSPGGIFVYENSSNQLMKRALSNIFSDITGNIENTDGVAADTLITITKGGNTYKLLAIAA